MGVVVVEDDYNDGVDEVGVRERGVRAGGGSSTAEKFIKFRGCLNFTTFPMNLHGNSRRCGELTPLCRLMAAETGKIRNVLSRAARIEERIPAPTLVPREGVSGVINNRMVLGLNVRRRGYSAYDRLCV